ncbi:MAG: AIR synthase family protein [Nitrososphaerales archaeon]
MPKLPKYGKITKDFFDRVIYPNLGTRRGEVLVGPSPGVDTCVVRVGRNSGKVVVATTDPISYIPELGARDSAWLSVNLIASDLATSGFAPQFALFDLNLPPTMKSSNFEKYWDALSRECEKLGIAIIGGHTGRFDGLNSTVIGAGVMFSVGREDRYLTSAGGKIGDEVVVTKGAAIATTGILARVFPDMIEKKMGGEGLERSRKYFQRTTVVKDALTAVKVGVRTAGITAMHDATEGGVLSALYELANASSVGLRVDLSKIPVSLETETICGIFKIDPFISLSEGSLIFSCRPSKTQKALSTLRSSGIKAVVVGELVEPEHGIASIDANDRETPIKYPVIDPYWNAYYLAKQRNWP